MATKVTNKHYIINEKKFLRVTNLISEFLGTTEKYNSIPKKILDTAIETGKTIHKAIELDLLNQKELANEIVKGNEVYKNLFEQYQFAKKELRLEDKNLIVEKKVVCLNSYVAGTPDLIVYDELDQEYDVIEWKTRSLKKNFTFEDLLEPILQVLVYARIFKTSHKWSPTIRQMLIVFLDKKSRNYKIINIKKWILQNKINKDDIKNIVFNMLDWRTEKLEGKKIIQNWKIMFEHRKLGKKNGK